MVFTKLLSDWVNLYNFISEIPTLWKITCIINLSCAFPYQVIFMFFKWYVANANTFQIL